MYIFDSNTFIQAKNLFYRFNFCSGYWDWLVDGAKAKKFYIAAAVEKELKKKEDEIKGWLDKMPGDFVIQDLADQDVVNNYAEVIRWANFSTHYSDKAKKEFSDLDDADALLIALGMKYKYKIATHEKSDPASKKKIFLPDAAKAFGVQCVTLYDVLNEHALPTFKFHLNAKGAASSVSSMSSITLPTSQNLPGGVN